MTRREVITRSLAVASPGTRLFLRAAGEDHVLDVAYAGSMASVMEGPIKQAAAAQLNLTLQGRAQGASGLAQLIVSRNIRPDVFISVTPSPMKTVLQAGMAQTAVPIARTEMVIAYCPTSRFASRFQAASQSNVEPWWRILEEPGLRFGRTDPVTDPQGRNIIFVMRLAARLYNQPDLVQRILGADINPEQIFTEPSVEMRLQSGQLDAASAYKIQPAPFHLPYVALPSEINLGGAAPATNAEEHLTINGKTYHPEPLIYYAAALKNTQKNTSAARFVEWLRSNSVQEIFGRFQYDPPGDTKELGAT
jgi:molybdate/tungstate transport system substrate-binding protein